MKKIDNYLQAVSQLETAVTAYQSNSNDALYRDGLIQRFEFSTELAWKSLKDYLEDQGLSISAITIADQICHHFMAAFRKLKSFYKNQAE